MKKKQASFKTLTIDIGGSHIKATVLNRLGEEMEDYKSIITPSPASPENVLNVIKKLATGFAAYDYVSVGFPGYVRDGIIQTAPNLGSEMWHKIKFEEMLGQALDKPAQVVNDADLQGVGTVSGKGFEILVTLGTGFGTAFLLDGVLLPHIELAHHPIRKHTDYDQFIGDAALHHIGVEKWNVRLQEVLKILNTVFNYDRLFISGGNARLINFKLAQNVHIVSNEDGIKGGAKLWGK